MPTCLSAKAHDTLPLGVKLSPLARFAKAAADADGAVVVPSYVLLAKARPEIVRARFATVLAVVETALAVAPPPETVTSLPSPP